MSERDRLKLNHARDKARKLAASGEAREANQWKRYADAVWARILSRGMGFSDEEACVPAPGSDGRDSKVK